MFALLVAIEPTSLYSMPRASDCRERSSALANCLRRSLMSARLMSASPSPTFDRDFRASASASSSIRVPARRRRAHAARSDSAIRAFTISGVLPRLRRGGSLRTLASSALSGCFSITYSVDS
jgi:hypothetical protein